MIFKKENGDFIKGTIYNTNTEQTEAFYTEKYVLELRQEIDRLNHIIDETLRFIKLHDLYHPANEFILLNILQGNDKKVDELTKAIIKAQGKELKEEGK